MKLEKPKGPPFGRPFNPLLRLRTAGMLEFPPECRRGHRGERTYRGSSLVDAVSDAVGAMDFFSASVVLGTVVAGFTAGFAAGVLR